jgi:hypothetical protein
VLWHFLKVSQRPHFRGNVRSTIRAVKKNAPWNRSLFVASLWIVGAQLACADNSQEAKDANGPIPSVGRQQLWATRIAQLVKEPFGWTETGDHEVDGLAFSPDDQQLAATITHVDFSPEGRRLFRAHLLVMNVQSPETNTRQFDLRGPCAGDPAWNEGGTALLACGSIVRPTDGTSCEVAVLPSTPLFWLDSERIVRSNTGEILNRACQPVDAWPLRPTWQILAVTTSGGWVLLLHPKGERQGLECDFSIARVASRPPLRRRWGQKVPCGMNAVPDIVLAEGADALCSSLGGAVNKPHCWAIQTGKGIRVPKGTKNYVIKKGAASSARVVAETSEYERDPWWVVFLWWVPVPGYPPVAQRQAVFDLRSGRWVSSWGKRMSYPIGTFYPHQYALSPSGEFLAESGDGGFLLELYRLAP